jgi:Zn-dependent peptidase ImmA (M78 family)
MADRWRSVTARVLADSEGLSDPVAAVVTKVRRLNAYGVSGPPFALRGLAKERRVSVVFDETLAGDASLSPSENGFTVTMNPSHSRSRQRFSFAHEIAHTFFFELGSRLGGRNRELDPAAAFLEHREEEELCDIAAREMLMPEPNFLTSARQCSPGMDGVRMLSRTYDVSLPASALRIVELAVWDCAIVYWDASRQVADANARVKWGASTRNTFIPKRAKARPDWLVATALTQPGAIIHASPKTRLGGLRSPMHVETVAGSFPTPDGDQRYALSLVRPVAGLISGDVNS